jgi:mono/diheme cytochrome c family protein
MTREEQNSCHVEGGLPPPDDPRNPLGSSPPLLALATSNKIWLAAFAGAFILFSLVSALVIPRRRPDFPGEWGRNWFILVTVALFVAMLFAVQVFAKEEAETAHGQEAGEVATEQPPGDEPQPQETTAGTSEGNPEAGEAVFASQGCGGCHAFAAAGTQASVGPDLDESLEGQDAAFVRESIVDPNTEVAEGFQPGVMPATYGEQLSPKQLADLVAFLTQS